MGEAPNLKNKGALTANQKSVVRARAANGV